jgi:hypothetical protein
MIGLARCLLVSNGSNKFCHNKTVLSELLSQKEGNEIRFNKPIRPQKYGGRILSLSGCNEVASFFKPDSRCFYVSLFFRIFIENQRGLLNTAVQERRYVRADNNKN